MVYLPPTERSDLVRCNAEETAAPTHAGFPHPHVGRLAYRPSQGVQKVCQRLELESKDFWLANGSEIASVLLVSLVVLQKECCTQEEAGISASILSCCQLL